MASKLSEINDHVSSYRYTNLGKVLSPNLGEVLAVLHLGMLCPGFYPTSSSSSSVICQTTGPKPLAKRFLHIVGSTASSFNSQYPLLSLRSSSNFLRLLPCLHVTSICHFIFPSITYMSRKLKF